MSTPTNPVPLTDQDRHQLKAWLVEFDQLWNEGRLAARVRQLPPPGNSLRLLALVELVKIDLQRRWQKGRRVRLEVYLKAYPELGTPDTVPLELIEVEIEARRRSGVPGQWTEFAKRFPRQAKDLRRRIEQAHPRAPVPVEDSQQTLGPEPTTAAWVRLSETPELPEHFGRYRILKKLGQGGMGEVYLAHDSQLDRRVALKVPHFTSQDGPEILERFHREARAAATLDHPNICPVFDVGEIHGRHYVTMAYIEGQPLSELIRSGKALPQRAAAGVVRKLAQALEEAHRQGVIHRDLKPSNVMVNQRHEPVVMDFGLARRIHKEDERLTLSGTILGTPAYMSPEQVKGDLRAMGPGCDIYSLGVILYEILTGQLPFQGPTAAVVGQILTQAPARPTSLRPDLDAPLEAICLKAMAKEVKDRFASMGDFATALARYLKGEISKKQTQETIPLGQGKPQAIPVPPATVGADQGEGEELATQLLTSLTDRLGAGAVPARPSRVGGKSGHQMQFWPLLMAVLFTVAGLVALAVFYRGPTENVSKEDKSDNPFKESLAPPTGERQQGSGREGSLREEKKEEPEVKPSAAVKPLIERLNDENAGVRRQVAESLEKLGDKSAVPALVRRVADDLWDSSDSYSKSSSSKKAALSALTVLGPERVTEALLKAAASATIPVRVFACEELGKQKDSESAAGLVAALKDPSEKVRRATAAALANVRPPVVLALAQALFDEDVTVRRQAAESLEILGNKSKLPASTVKQVAAEAVPALVRRVADDLWYPSDSYSKSRSSKRAALSALKMLGPEKISEALLGALHSKNEPVRIWACEELANQKDKESIAGLTAALSKDPSERVRAAAAAALSNNPTRGQTP